MQGSTLHACVSTRLEPTQSSPPYLGAGLLQNRCRRCTPLPHSFEHLPHIDHAVQTPLTGTATE